MRISALAAGVWSLQLSRFTLVGIVATMVYVGAALALASLVDDVGSSAAIASCGGYLVAAAFSYAGHKYFTFNSKSAHAAEAPRFLLAIGCGLAVSIFLPMLLGDTLGLAAGIPILITSVAIPVVNYIVLERWVFQSKQSPR